MSSAYVNETCDMILDTSFGFGSTERYLKPIVTQVSVFSLLPGNRPRVKAQLVVYRTEKAGSMLTRVRVFSADSYGVRTTPVYTWHASTSVDTLKTPTLAAMPLAGHTKILHTLTGMGSKHWQPCRWLDTPKYYTHLLEWVAILL